MSELKTAPLQDCQFVVGGNATFTIEVPESFAAEHGCQPWYTYNVSLWPADQNSLNRDIYNVSLLSGPDNTANYTYLGQLNSKNGAVRLTKKSRYKLDSWPVRLLRRMLCCLFSDELKLVTDAGFQVHHEGRCCRCGRKLTTPASVERGIGPYCMTKG